MKKKHTEMEPIAIKRATVADSDKVRYRVYRAEGDFIAVIAESALMAMKVSGIAVPHRIVRDLPSEGVSIEAQRMAKVSAPERVSLPTARTQKVDKASFMQAEIADKTTPLNSQFVPMGLAELKKKPLAWARVLTPEMVHDIRQKSGVAEEKPVAAMPAPETASPGFEAAPQPVTLAPEPMDEIEIEPPASAPATGEPGVLSEEEVQKLLNS